MEKQELQDFLVPHFEWFHRHPELGDQEYETTARIREILSRTGVEILDTGLKTGLVARISGRGAGPVVALRGDIDALPITEASGNPCISEYKGRMHACGHDFHLTAMIGAALLLQNQRDQLAGTVKLLFQPAEETVGGAKQILAAGLLDDVQEIYGLHVKAADEPGLISIKAGAVTAAVGSFRLIVRGKGGHAAVPQGCVDPVIAVGQIINAAQTIVSRNISPFDQAVVSITHVEAGNTWNVIPQDAFMEGTIRALDTDLFKNAAERLGRIAEGVGRSTDTQIEYQWRLDAPSTNNDPTLAEFVAGIAKSLGLPVKSGIFGMVGEDFALYQERIPGVFWTIGAGSPQAEHHPGFIADTASLHSASELLAALGKAALNRLSLDIT
jgi:amidohydrolase